MGSASHGTLVPLYLPLLGFCFFSFLFFFFFFCIYTFILYTTRGVSSKAVKNKCKRGWDAYKSETVEF